MMPPQPSGNRPQFAGDAPTRFLPTVDMSKPYRPPVTPSWDGTDRDATVILRRFADETAVIPVTPAKPGPKANNDDPWKECFGAAVAGLVLAAFIFVAGVLVGAAVF